MVPKPGWLNRQFDQVSKNVDSWPDWMKRGAGFEEETRPQHPQKARDKEEPLHDDRPNGQRNLRLET